MSRGVYLNDIPLDLFLKYFTSEDLQDGILEAKLIDDVRDYYVYDVTVGSNTYTYYSHLNLDGDGDALALEAYKDLLDLEPSLAPGDIDPSTDISLDSTVSSAQMYVSAARIGAIYPNRYSFEYESDGEVLGFIGIDGSIDTISDITSIVISDSRTGDDALGYNVDLVLNSAEGRYYVYNSSTLALVGYVYENDKSTRQKTNAAGLPLFVDESGNETTEPLRRSRMLRHSSAIRNAFFPGDYIRDPREITFTRFMPGVVGLYKQGTARQLAYYEDFIRTKSYERVALTGQDFSDIVVPDEIKDELATIGDTYEPDPETERKLRTLLDFSSIRRVSTRFYNTSSMQFYSPQGQTAPASGDVLLVNSRRRLANYDSATYDVNISSGLEKITVSSLDLEIGSDENSGRTFVRLPIQRELSQTNSRYFVSFASATSTLAVFSDTTKTWTNLLVENVFSVSSESDITISGGSVSIQDLFGAVVLGPGTKVYIAGSDLLKKVNSTSTALESATAVNNYAFVPLQFARKNSQANALYFYSGSSWSRVGYAQSRPSTSDLYNEFVAVGSEKFSVSSYTQTIRPVEKIGLVNPTIRGTTYQIKTNSTNPIYSLGYIEYPVSISESDIGTEYIGQVTSVSSGIFTLGKYAPTYSDTGVNSEDFALEGYTESAGSYSRVYYIRDLVDRTLGIEVTETISKSGDNADDTSNPKWTEFIDYNHVQADSGSLTAVSLRSGRTAYRLATAVSSSSTLQAFEARFAEFEHSVVDGSFGVSPRGDLIPEGAVELSRRDALGQMAADFLNRPGSEVFSVQNVGKDESATMKMRILCEGLLEMATSSQRFSPASIGLGRSRSTASELSDMILLQKLEVGSGSQLTAREYGEGYFAAERAAAAAEVKSLNAFQRLHSYERFPTNESKLRSEYGSRVRARILSESTSSESAKDDIVSYDVAKRSLSVPKSAFKKGLKENILGLFYESTSYSSGNFYVDNYYKYYKGKLDSLQPSYSEESSSPAYKSALSRSELASDPSDLVELILNRFDESGNATEWRVL